MMKSRLTLLTIKNILAWMVVLSTASVVHAGEERMGDWQGSMKLSESSKDVVAQVIDMGNGLFEARVLGRFEESGRPFITIPGKDVNGKVSFGGSLEKGSLTVSMQDGKVSLSFWVGMMDDGKFICQKYDVTDDGGISGIKGDSFEMKPVKRLSPTMGKKAPKGAVVLLGEETKTLEDWARIDGDKRPEARWKIVEPGVMQVHGGDVITKKEFSKFHMHVEFKTPYMPGARGQGRGNSGVYILGRYEVQVLDSYGLSSQWNDCGGIYSVSKPRINMCAPPGQWQTYDIDFAAPEFDDKGVKTKNAKVTVVHNGVNIHDNIELPKPTGGAIKNEEVPSAGIKLQDHGNPVQYRNIWILEK